MLPLILIELLVVIAIRAVLLFPAFVRAQEKARQTDCLSDRERMETAALMYGQNHDEQFPLCGYLTANATGQPCALYLPAAVKPYVKNHQIYQCPSEPWAVDIDAGFRAFGIPGGEGGGLAWASDNFNYAITNISASIGSIEFPAETALTSDGNLALSGACAFGALGSPVQAHHNDIVNACYANGHSKTFTASCRTVLG